MLVPAFLKPEEVFCETLIETPDQVDQEILDQKLVELTMSISARRIQRAFKAHLTSKRQATLWQALNLAVNMIQSAYRHHLFRQGLQWRVSVKHQLMAVITAWRTRRALNSLASEV